MNNKSGLLSIIILLFSLGTYGQQTTIPVKTPFKPPVVKTYIGIRSGNDTVHLEEATQLVKLPLVVKDEKGSVYKLVNYRLLYKKKGYVENLQTGKPELHYTTVASRFDDSPLPKVWSDNIQLTLKSGEELFFFEILVSDANGRKFYAPDIKLIIR